MIPSLKLKKRTLTLLEIIIVVALIGMMAVYGGWSLTDLLAQHRRQAEIEELKNFMQELQIEALALQSDFEITFSKKEKKLQVHSKTSEKILPNRTVTLHGVCHLKFRDRADSNFILKIFSTGRIDPSGVLEIEREKGSLWIDMHQPLSLKFLDQRPSLITEVIPEKPKKKESVCS